MPCSGTRFDTLRPLLATIYRQTDAAAKLASSTSPFEGDDAKEHYPPDVPLRPTHIFLDLDLDIPSKTLVATVSTTVVATRNGARSIRLNAERFDEIHAVHCYLPPQASAANNDNDVDTGMTTTTTTTTATTAAAAAASPTSSSFSSSSWTTVAPSSFSYDGHCIHVVMDPPGLSQVGQEALVTVSYKVVDPSTGLFFSRAGDTTHYVVSDHETERARYWLPCVDHPSIRTTLLFRITTESGLTVLANGHLVSSEKIIQDSSGNTNGTQGRTLTTWKMDQITPSYLICIAVGKFVKASGGEIHGKEIAFFAPQGGPYPYASEDLAETFGKTLSMIQWIEKKLACPLPWPKYYQFAVGEIGGAMENSSLVSWDESAITDPRDREEWGWQVNCTNVHELAHSYFGNSVVCADFAFSFLKESFAKFIEIEWLNETVGQDDMHHHLALSAARYFSEAASYVRPIVTRRYDASWSMFDYHLYPGGAWRLHMLRNKLGNQVFWNGVADYIQMNKWNTVEPNDLRRALERRSGLSLAKYFDQWFEKGVGHPILEVSVKYQAECGGLTTITVKQTQMDSYRGIGLFDIEVEIALEVVEDHWQTHIVHLGDDTDGRGGLGRIVVALPRQPLQVIVDPNALLLHKLAKLDCGEDSLKRSLVHAPTYAGRLMAVYLLMDSGSRSALAAVCEALSSEEHWGLRVHIARALAQSGKVMARDALIEALQHETDKRTIMYIVQALAEFRAPEIVGKALEQFLLTGKEMNRGYLAMMYALSGLGNQRSVQFVPLLTQFLEDPKLRGKGARIHTGAVIGLGSTRNLQALEVLLRNGKPGRHDHEMLYFVSTREAIMSQVATCVELEGPAVRSRVFDYLENVCLTDAEYGVRMAAARALCRLSDAGNALKAVDRIAKDAINQDVPSVRGMRAECRSNRMNRDGGSSFGISSNLDKLQEDLRVAIVRLDEIEAQMNARFAIQENADLENAVEDQNDLDDDSITRSMT